MKHARIFNKALSIVLAMVMVLSMLPMSVFATQNDEGGGVTTAVESVAKVGDTEYATIDEAIANWTNGTTLTLLADVTLTDVIQLSSTEYHVLDLGTYTMTAASKKDAIQIVNNGRISAGYALDIKADAENPGGITASGKTVVVTTGKSGVKDRPIIRFYNGVFNASYVVEHSRSNGTNCPQFQFHGGVFNGTISTNRALNQFYGGTFNGGMFMSVDSSAYTLVAGGTFKNLSNSYNSTLNSSKFTIGSAKGVYDKEVYVDDNGNYVIAASAPESIEAGVAKTPGTNDYLAYSKVAAEGSLNYTDVYTALEKNKSAEVTVYVDELDMTKVSSFKGTVVVPEGQTVTITVAEGTTPTWTVSEGADVAYVDADGNELVVGENGEFAPTVGAEPENPTGVVIEGIDATVTLVEGTTNVYDVTTEAAWPSDGVKMTFPVEGADEGASAYVVHEHEGDTYVYAGTVENGGISFTNTVGFSTFTVNEGGIQEAVQAAAPSGTVEIVSDVTVDVWKMISETLSPGAGEIIQLDIDSLTINGNGHTLTVKSVVSNSNGNELFYTDVGDLFVNELTIRADTAVADNFKGIGLNSGKISNVTFKGGYYSIVPGTGDITIEGCTFETNGTAVYCDHNTTYGALTITGNTFDLSAGEYAAFLYDGMTFSNNTVKTGRVNVVSGSPVVTGNNFGTERFKVYNAATATITDNTINNLVFNDATVTQATFENNTLSDAAQAALDAVSAPAVTYAAMIGDVKYATLGEAMGDVEDGQTVVLLADAAIDSECYTISDGVSVTLNMNGKKLTVTDNDTDNYELFYIYGELTVTGDGTIELTSTNNRGWSAMSAIFHNRGGVLTIENGTFKNLGGTDMAWVVDNSGNYYGDAVTNVKGGVLECTYTAIRNRMEQNTHGASGTAILNISGGTITGTTSAIWAQAASVSDVAPATGEINVTGGEVGLINTARSAGAECMTTISGGTVNGFKGEVGELTVTNAASLTGDVTILTAAGEPADYVITAEGLYAAVTYVAQIGDVKYATLEEAIAAAQAGDEIVLIADVSYVNVASEQDKTTSIYVPAGKEFTLDLNGYVISGENDVNGSFALMTICRGANITIDDTSADKTGKITYKSTREVSNYNEKGYTIGAMGILVLNGGTIENSTPLGSDGFEKCVTVAIDVAASDNEMASFTMNGGEVISQTYFAIRANVYSGNKINSENVVVLNAGTVYGLHFCDWGSKNLDYRIAIGDDAVIEHGSYVDYPDQAIRLVIASAAESEIAIDIAENAQINGSVHSPIAKVGAKYYYTIEKAITGAAAGDTVTILADEIVFAEDAASIVVDKAITIDGNGANLVFDSATSAFVIKCSDVTIKNVTVTQGAKDNSFGISIDKGAWDAPAVQYANVTIQNVDFVGGNYALCLIGENVVVDDCSFTGQDSHNIIVYSLKGDSKITDNYFGASKGDNKSAILWEGGVSTELTGDALDAFMGGGSLTVSGNTAVGKGVFFQFTNWGLVKDVNVTIANNEVDAFTNKAIAIYTEDDSAASGDEFASFTVTGNVFTNVPSGRTIVKEYTGTVAVDASANYLGSAEPDYAALLVGDKVTVNSYYAAYDAENGLQDLTEIKTAVVVAKIGDVEYTDLQEAINAANGATVTLLADVTYDTVYTSNKTHWNGDLNYELNVSADVVLDLNGYTIKSVGGSSHSYYALICVRSGSLTVQDSSEAKTGAIICAPETAESGAYTIYNNGALTVNGGTISNTKGGRAIQSVTTHVPAALTINGGTVESTGIAVRVASEGGTGTHTVIFNGGTINAGSYALWVPMKNGGSDVINLTVNDGVFNGKFLFNSYVSADADFTTDTVTIVGGDFKGNVLFGEQGNEEADAALIARMTGSVISGGTFVNDVSTYVAEGYELKQNADGTYGVVKEAKTYLAEMNGEKYETVAAALEAAKAANMTDVVITVIGENTKETFDTFDLYQVNEFDSVTLKQADTSKPYYFDGLYTGSRTNGGTFVFDGVNVVVTEQYIFEGNVKLTNNCVVKSTAEANCFQYYSTTTVEPGSKLYGIIDDFRGGDVTVDGGKTDGSYSAEPDMRDSILNVNWSGDSLTLKNGAYLKVNAANEVGRLTVESGAALNVYASKLESWQWIAVNGTLNTDAGSIITTKQITGAGKIVIDATAFEGESVRVIEADMTGFNGTIEVTGGYEATADAEGVTLNKAKQPSGKVSYRAYINDSASREAIQIDLENVYAKESFEIKLYDANGNLLTTTALRQGGVEAANYTANIVLWGTASGSWNTEIHATLTDSNVPEVIEVWADGVLVDTYENAFGVGTNVNELPKYLALDCVEKGLPGSGTQEDPFVIDSLADLILFRDSVNGGDTKYNAPGVYVALGADIDMSGTDWSVNIGDDCSATFDGIFDGQNHTIRNLTGIETAQKSDGYVCTGLFGAIYGSAVVKNLTIENVTIDTGDFTGNNAAAVVGFAYNCTGSVENVKVIGNIAINAKNVTGTGAIVGYDFYGKLTVKGCSVIGNDGSYVTGRAYVGGVIGYASSNSAVSGCSVENVAITATGCAAGGIAGIMLGTGKVTDSSVKNVALVSANANWQNAAAAAVGTISGGAVTVSNVAVENVTANGVATTALVGSQHADKPTAPVGKVEARIGDTYYATWEAALAAAEAGETVTLLVPIVIEKGEEVVIDLAGKTISHSVACTESYQMILNKGTLTVTDSVGGGKISFTDTGAGDPAFGWGSYTIYNQGSLVVEGGTIEHLGQQNADSVKHMYCAIFQYSGSTTVKGGTISTPTYRSVRLWKGDMTIEGGTFEGQVWVQSVDDSAKLTISGGTFAPRGVDGSSVFVGNVTNAGVHHTVDFSVTGGTFETKIGANDADKVVGGIAGGQFTEAAKTNTNSALLADSFEFETAADENGYYGVVNNSLFEITMTNMRMGQNLAVMVAFEQANITDELSNYVANVSVAHKDGAVNSTITSDMWTATTINGVAYYIVEVPGLAAKEMDDDITITIYKGDEAVSKPKITSLRRYGEERLANSSDTEFKTTVVDMLNYGAAAQIQQKYNTENLANRNIDEYQYLATSEDSMNLTKVNTVTSGSEAFFAGVNMRFVSDISMVFAVYEDSQAVSAKITFVNHLGKSVENEVEEYSMATIRENKARAFEFTGMVVADIDQDVTVEFFDAEGNTVMILDSSINSYLRSMKTAGSSEMKDLAIAFGKFSTSAYTFLH